MPEPRKHFIMGNTFDVKDQLKELGCKWDSESNQWYHTSRKGAAEAQSWFLSKPKSTSSARLRLR